MLLCNLLHLSQPGYNRELTVLLKCTSSSATAQTACHHGVQGHSRSLMSVPVEKARMRLSINE